jgi:hypothetical protein
VEILREEKEVQNTEGQGKEEGPGEDCGSGENIHVKVMGSEDHWRQREKVPERGGE